MTRPPPAQMHSAPFTLDSSGQSKASRLDALEAVLFDLDGTLIDSLGMILSSMRFATQTVLGEALSDEQLMHNVGIPLIAQMREFDVDRAQELLVAYREHNEIVHDELVREFPGVDTALQTLGSRYRLGVVTSKSGPVAQRGLDVLGLGSYFEVLVAFEDTSAHKPGPEPLIEAARLLDVPLALCAYVGDSPHDMCAAIAAGAVSIGALWGVAGERVLEPGPDYAVASMGELAKLLAPSD